MKYCKRCLYPENHPLNIIINEEGICSGCIIHEEKFTINWNKKEEELLNILSTYKNNNELSYDCIIPISGAKDSYFIVDTIKNKYGMNPLLVSYNKHYNTHIGNRNLAYLKTIFNCDTMECVVQPQKVKKITKVTLEKMGSIYWHVIAGNTVFPVQVAVRLQIPLIIWGAHQGLDQVGMFSHDDEVEMTRKYRKEHDLMGYEAEDLIGMNGLTENDLSQYMYPDNEELEKVGVRGIYLGNYLAWDSKLQHEEMIKKCDYETRQQQRTIDTYHNNDCVHYNGLHDYIKFLKFGYSKINDQMAREIRWGRIKKGDALELINKYQDIMPNDIPLFLEWINMTETELFNSIDQFRDSKVWTKTNEGWELKYNIQNCSIEEDQHIRSIRKNKEELKFIITKSKNPRLKEDSYTLIEKGYIQ
jgi:N-acetyl sugar amidotransferase